MTAYDPACLHSPATPRTIQYDCVLLCPGDRRSSRLRAMGCGHVPRVTDIGTDTIY